MTSSHIRYFIITLFALLTMAKTEADYMLAITIATPGDHAVITTIKLDKERIFGESKKDTPDVLDIDSVKQYAITQLNAAIKEKGFEPKTENTFEHASFEVFFGNHKIDRYTTESCYVHKADDGTEVPFTFRATINTSF